MAYTEKHTLGEWRRMKNISRVSLAAMSGTTERTIANYEESNDNLRKASYERIEALASALDLTIDNFDLQVVSI
ncbi:helix-turn-helix transcriptional regulator [Weissella cibaria]|uniref:helix-turn-helix domain-containing protein n=1 Tax=Weissella cibaria TaxID=137591 RepID=UPI001C1FB485|nr:helix-turn-helix transcriptional regulator [Weissella cibaria]MBU7561169.1 helix-turn-helix transcriptional regulator [Weissella cibaria]